MTVTATVDKRFAQIAHWLSNDLELSIEKLEPASADASFRRYFRLTTHDGTLVIMDAPPEKESTEPFIEIARALQRQGVHTPNILASNVADGFLLLEDLGDRTYLPELKSTPKTLYTAAIDSLIMLQNGINQQPDCVLPIYDEPRLRQEMSLFEEWFLGRHLGIELDTSYRETLTSLQDILIAGCLDQPQVWVHRDYHSRNLMITAQNSPGVIDFQDMVIGPIAYDLASIFKDCYIEWPRGEQIEWLERYLAKAQSKLTLPAFSLQELCRWYDFCGLQRHLKVLGVFCRLNYRDGKQHYLADLPLVAKYVIDVLGHYTEFEPFQRSFGSMIERAL